MELKRLIIDFIKWWENPNCPESLEKADVEECVLAWADATETDLGDNLDALCKALVEYGVL